LAFEFGVELGGQLDDDAVEGGHLLVDELAQPAGLAPFLADPLFQPSHSPLQLLAPRLQPFILALCGLDGIVVVRLDLPAALLRVLVLLPLLLEGSLLSLQLFPLQFQHRSLLLNFHLLLLDELHGLFEL
jgi:hypothetical protein